MKFIKKYVVITRLFARLAMATTQEYTTTSSFFENVNLQSTD